ncbi:TonB-dependent receptor [Pseudoalteromonas xiamenensis]|uniref:TonB-dependent receptor n=1 Tax=Pseudoalteromonas xiamenensis TaxID=882626 RepID=A0A975DHA5_9GAMM|nr:TonB-dependent receptor [Pseudoalteromonas xiamenensis]QTH70281.1 TonB-dependent receptor [Pseudoalteromonas xiamenensis]
MGISGNNKRILPLCIAAALTGSNFYAHADDANLRQSMEKIVVVGEKTERTLKDTASSVAVLDASIIDSGQLLSMSDALSEVANIVVLTGAAPDIRGVSGNGSATGFNSFSGGAKARVTTLVDGVSQPFVADLTGDTGLWDIEQVEVYRGPQSTSNGRNSIAGAVYVKTKDPSFDWEGALRVGYQNQDSLLDTAAVISGPLIADELAFRLSSQLLDGDTYSNPPVFESNPTNRNLNQLRTTNTQFKLLYQPKNLSGFSSQLSYQHYEEKGNTGRKYFAGSDPFAYEPLFQRIMDTKSETTSLKLDYQINASLSLDMLVSYMDYQWGFEAYEMVAARESDVTMFEDDLSIDTKLNFGLSSDFYRGFVGVVHYQRDQTFNSRGATIYDGEDTSKSKAIYGETSINVSNAWTVIGGVRVEREQQQRDFIMQQQNGPLNATLDNSKTFVLPKLVIQYDLSDTTKVSLSARRGYNAGGGAVSFVTNEYYYYDAESVYTYELSARSVFNNGDVNVSANLFYNNFNDYQAMSSARVISNIKDAHSVGLELDAHAMLGRNWQVHGGVGLIQSEIDAADVGFESAVGNELNSAPALTANIGVTHWFSDAFSVNINTQYVGEFFADLQNSEERVAGDYVLTRAAITYEYEHWQLNAYLNNLFDEHGYTTREPASTRYPDGYAAVVKPRTFGISATYRY